MASWRQWRRCSTTFRRFCVSLIALWLRVRRRRQRGCHWSPVLGILEIDSAHVRTSPLRCHSLHSSVVPASRLASHYGSTGPRHHGESAASQALRWRHTTVGGISVESAASHEWRRLKVATDKVFDRGRSVRCFCRCWERGCPGRCPAQHGSSNKYRYTTKPNDLRDRLCRSWFLRDGIVYAVAGSTHDLFFFFFIIKWSTPTKQHQMIDVT